MSAAECGLVAFEVGQHECEELGQREQQITVGESHVTAEVLDGGDQRWLVRDRGGENFADQVFAQRLQKRHESNFPPTNGRR